MDPITIALINIGIGLLFSLAGTLLSSAFAQKESGTGLTDSYAVGDDVPLRFIVGTVGTKGKLEYENSWSGGGDIPRNYLAQVFSLSDLPITALTGLYVFGSEVTLGTSTVGTPGYAIPEYTVNGLDLLFWYPEMGSQTTANAYLTSTFGSDPDRPWTSDMIGRGIAHVLMTAHVSKDKFTSFPDYVFEAQGIKLYDPRKDGSLDGTGAHRLADPTTWEFSDNPIVIIYNILLGIYYDDEWVWGSTALRNAADGSINSDAVEYALPYSSWSAAMTRCDQTVNLKAGGTEKAFRAGRVINCDEAPADVIAELLRACNGRISEGAGVYRVLVGPVGAAVATFTDDDVIVSEGQTYDGFPALDQIVNGATSTYLEPAQAWAQTNAPPYYRTDLEAEDDGRRQLVDLNLTCVFSGTQTQRIQKAVVLEGRRFLKYVVVLPPSFSRWQPLEVLEWTSTRNAFTSKAFLITGCEEAPNGNVMMTLQEVDATDHDWTPNDDEQDFTAMPVPDGQTGQPREPFYPATLDELADEVIDLQARMASSLRDVQAQLMSITESLGEVTGLDGGQLQELRESLTAAVGSARAEWRNEVQVYAGPTSALALASQEINLTLNDATVAIQSVLGGSIETFPDAMSAAATASLAATLILDAATLSMISAFGGSVTSFEDGIDVMATAVTDLEGLIGDSSGQAVIRLDLSYTPSSGWDASIGLMTANSIGGTGHYAGLYLESKSDASRILLDADSIVVSNGGVPVALFEAGTTYIEVARIHSLDADNITAKSIDADDILIDGTLITDLIAAGAVSVLGASVTGSDTQITTSPSDTTYDTVASVTLTPDGGGLLVIATGVCFATTSDAAAFGYASARLTRAGVEVQSVDYIFYDDNPIESPYALVYRDSSPGAISRTYANQVKFNTAPGGGGGKYLGVRAGASVYVQNLKV